MEVLLGPNRSNLDAKDTTGNCAIHYAAVNGHVDCIRKLVEKGVDINRAGPSGKTPLHIAASLNDVEMTKFLLENGAKNTSKDKFGRSALILAVMNGAYQVASILLAKGAPFDLPDKSTNHPLHYACAYGYPELIDLLMEAGCDPNLKNDWGLNATTVALLKNYFDCVRKMLEYPKTDVNCVDNDGRSLISNTVKSITEENFENFIFLLDEKSADTNSQDQHGLSTLHHVCRITPLRAVEANHPDFHSKPLPEQQEILETTTSLYKKFIKSLIDHNADVNLVTKDGLSPIFLALTNKNAIATRYLLENPSVNLNLRTKEGDTVFHYMANIALDDEFMEVFQLIVDTLRDCKPLLNTVNKAGKSGLHALVDSIAAAYSVALPTYIQEFEQEIMLKKQAQIDETAYADLKKSENQFELKRSKKYAGLKGGARVKQTARMSTMAAFPRKAFTSSM